MLPGTYKNYNFHITLLSSFLSFSCVKNLEMCSLNPKAFANQKTFGIMKTFICSVCDEGPGICAHLMTMISILLIMATLPFSLLMAVKVVQVCHPRCWSNTRILFNLKILKYSTTESCNWTKHNKARARYRPLQFFCPHRVDSCCTSHSSSVQHGIYISVSVMSQFVSAKSTCIGRKF